MDGEITTRQLDACAAGSRTVRDHTQAVAQSSSGETLALNEFSTSQLRQFFELLDELDRKANDKRRDVVQISNTARGAAGGA